MKRNKHVQNHLRRADRLHLFVNRCFPPGVRLRQRQLNRWCLMSLGWEIKKATVSIRFIDEAEGVTLNREWRGKDYATNILSFALHEGEKAPGMEGSLIGDLVLCVPVVEKEASEQDIDPVAHYAHLIIHGMLHLQGCDHQTDDDAKVMESLEIKYLLRLGYKDPYLL